MKEAIKLIADAHLGKLARTLRLLGLDTLYENTYTATLLLTMAAEQNRVLLSRNVALHNKNGVSAFIVTSENPWEQLHQVIEHFNLQPLFQPFSRCLVCNGILRPVEKKEIVHLLQPNTINYFNEFWQCADCRRVYWKGSHYERMLKTIERMLS